MGQPERWEWGDFSAKGSLNDGEGISGCLFMGGKRKTVLIKNQDGMRSDLLFRGYSLAAPNAPMMPALVAMPLYTPPISSA